MPADRDAEEMAVAFKMASTILERMAQLGERITALEAWVAALEPWRLHHEALHLADETTLRQLGRKIDDLRVESDSTS